LDAPPDRTGTVQLAATEDEAINYIRRKRLSLAAHGNDATSDVLPTPTLSGFYREYEDGVIVYTDAVGAVSLTHRMFNRWISLEDESAPEHDIPGATFANMLEFVGAPTFVLVEPLQADGASFPTS
jgi:hypothetical protein